MTDETIPGWAQGLIREIAVLNEKIPNHIEYTTRNIGDHEDRIRAQETITASIANSMDRITKLEENELEIFTRIRKLETRVWLAVGGLTVLVSAVQIISSLASSGLFTKG